MPVIETERRRSDWVEGAICELGDGASWHLAVPRVAFRLPENLVGEPILTVPTRDSNSEFSATFEAMRGTLAERLTDPDYGSHLGLARATYAIAQDLLIRNYTLTADESRELLDVIPGDAANLARWVKIAQVALYGQAALQ